MSPSSATVGRLRAYLRFIVAVLWFFMARTLARHEALGVTNEQWRPLAEQSMLLFLLLMGYASMAFALDRQQHPLSAQGLPRRRGWLSEVGLGLAVGWGVAVVCILPMVLSGGIAIVLILNRSAGGWLLADAAFFAVAAMAEELTYRGYGFQRFEQSVGSLGATLGFAIFYAIMQALLPGSNRVSIAVSLALSFVLSMAYLRSRALWVSWGINFGWKASRALLFGLAIGGDSSHSPVVQGNPMGSFWLTGGGYGLDASWIAFVVLLLTLAVVYRVTRELDFKYNEPEIVAGGIPVDLEDAARRQHEAAMGSTEVAPPPLVQILPTSSQPENPGPSSPSGEPPQ